MSSCRTLSATFHLTHNCNLRCAYCYTGEKVGRDMAWEVADRAIDFCLEEAKAQSADHLEVVFFGGEPLLKKELLYRIADEVRARAGPERVSFKTSTNGLLLDRAAMNELGHRNVYVSLSIDGTGEVHNRQRLDVLGKGTWSRLKARVPEILEWNPCTNATAVVTPESAHHLDASVQSLYDLGFRYMTTALEHGADWTPEALGRLGAAYERLGDWYVERTLQRDKMYLSCFDNRIASRARGPVGEGEGCSFGVRGFSIASSGRLYPCVQFVQEDDSDEYCIGDINTGFLAAREQLQAVASAEQPDCEGCAIRDRCANWCACARWQSTGRLDQASPLICAHERLLIPIADRVANRLWKRRSRLFVHKHYDPAYPALSFIEDLIVQEVPRDQET